MVVPFGLASILRKWIRSPLGREGIAVAKGTTARAKPCDTCTGRRGVGMNMRSNREPGPGLAWVSQG